MVKKLSTILLVLLLIAMSCVLSIVAEEETATDPGVILGLYLSSGTASKGDTIYVSVKLSNSLADGITIAGFQFSFDYNNTCLTLNTSSVKVDDGIITQSLMATDSGGNKDPTSCWTEKTGGGTSQFRYISIAEAAAGYTSVGTIVSMTFTVEAGDGVEVNLTDCFTPITTDDTFATVIGDENAGTVTLTSFGVEVQQAQKLELKTSETYSIDDNYYLIGFAAETSVTDMTKAFSNAAAQVRIVKSDGTTELTSDAKVGTGCIVQLVVDGEVKDSVTVVVKGDVNGDGEISANDCALIYYHIRGIDRRGNIYILTNEYLLASDTSGDGITMATDCALIYYHIRGIDKRGNAYSLYN